MRRYALCLAVLAGTSLSLHAQQVKPDTGKKEPPKIEDNSFLAEEAYNQEYGVVQHINTFQRSSHGSWAYSFTQEWPAPSQRHQLSYTVPVYRFTGSGTSVGVGDVALNYRYQALGKDEEPLWASPRLSVYLPTGDVNKGRGVGGPGLELMLPVSYALNEELVTHWDAGVLVSRAKQSGITATTKSFKLAGSAIWLVSPNVNLMLESTFGRAESLGGDWQNSFIVSPGMRGAFNFASGLQIVPGIAFPVGFGPSNGQHDLFLYLSFEHPFR
jgi:hypothetical protein